MSEEKFLNNYFNDLKELISFKDNGIDDIMFLNQPEGTLYPESKLEENEKKLFGFIDRFNERISEIENFD